jgi:hypothetical protein
MCMCVCVCVCVCVCTYLSRVKAPQKFEAVPPRARLHCQEALIDTILNRTVVAGLEMEVGRGVHGVCVCVVCVCMG